MKNKSWMKIISQTFFLVFLLNCSVFPAMAEWTWMNPLPQGNSLNGIYGISSDHIYAVGDYGTILRWDGLNWSQESRETDLSLRDVWGSSADHVFAVGGEYEMGGVI
ncbi:hypothetical protein K8T06_00705, partial [bacterium]|nr:hypothetical protein [bacterium]